MVTIFIRSFGNKRRKIKVPKLSNYSLKETEDGALEGTKDQHTRGRTETVQAAQICPFLRGRKVKTRTRAVQNRLPALRRSLFQVGQTTARMGLEGWRGRVEARSGFGNGPGEKEYENTLSLLVPSVSYLLWLAACL